MKQSIPKPRTIWFKPHVQVEDYIEHHDPLMWSGEFIRVNGEPFYPMMEFGLREFPGRWFAVPFVRGDA